MDYWPQQNIYVKKTFEHLCVSIDVRMMLRRGLTRLKILWVQQRQHQRAHKSARKRGC